MSFGGFGGRSDGNDSHISWRWNLEMEETIERVGGNGVNCWVLSKEAVGK
jgi:hypothetical protein